MEEGYFHRLYIEGWLEAFDEQEVEQGRAALKLRLPLALSWFGHDDASDTLIDQNIRTSSVTEARKGFIEDLMNRLTTPLDLSDEEVTSLLGVEIPADWDEHRRRPSDTAMPPTLWEFMVPTSEPASWPAGRCP